MWPLLVVLLVQEPRPEPPPITRAQAITRAREALVEALDVAAESVELLRAQSVRWPDASLGCPEEGRRYPAVATSGYRISLRVGKQTHWVHVGPTAVVVCGSSPRSRLRAAPAPGPPELDPPDPLEPELEELVARARRDLASRLSLEEREIDTIRARWVTWSNSSLGCPQPGVAYLQVLCAGAQIRLRAGERAFEYHSGSNREPFLCERPRPPLGASPRERR